MHLVDVDESFTVVILIGWVCHSAIDLISAPWLLLSCQVSWVGFGTLIKNYFLSHESQAYNCSTSGVPSPSQPEQQHALLVGGQVKQVQLQELWEAFVQVSEQIPKTRPFPLFEWTSCTSAEKTFANITIVGTSDPKKSHKLLEWWKCMSGTVLVDCNDIRSIDIIFENIASDLHSQN